MKNFKKIIFAVLVLGVVSLPMISFGEASVTTTAPPVQTVAQACPAANGVDIGNIICKIGFFLNKIIPVLLALGVIYFIWGVVTYMISEDKETKDHGRGRIIYGIIGLAIIVGMWGLVNLVITGFGLDQSNMPPINVTLDNTKNVDTAVGCYNKYKTNLKPIASDLLTYASCIISSSVVPFLFILASAVFIWGVVQTVINPAEEAKKEKGRQFMIWGIIALTVMVSMWGLVRIFGNTFGIDVNKITMPIVEDSP